MRILMVAPYPPHRDGIAAYTVQSVRALRAAGHDVEVLSPGPSAAHHHLDLVGPRGALALARRVRDYDKVLVQFHPDFFYRRCCSPGARLRESLALAVAFRRARRVEVVVHEIDGRHGRAATLDGQVTRLLWRSVHRVHVHTERERRDFVRHFGVPAARVAVADHGADFVPATHHDRASARESLGVPPEAFMFLSIGFVQPHKGFDRAVRAFAGLGVPGARLDVVGSVRVEDPSFVTYSEELAALVDRVPGAHLHRGFVSDELFDRWIVAADVVVLPYRSIWSSGVLERARLFGRPVIATAVGGLVEQAAALQPGADGEGAPGAAVAVGALGTADGADGADGDGAGPASGPPVVLVPDDAALAAAMRVAAGGDTGPVTSPWPGPGGDLRARVQAEVVSRAAAARGSRLALLTGGAGAGLPGRPGRSAGPAGPTGPAGSPDGATALGGLPDAVSASLRRLRDLDPAAPPLGGPLARTVKRVVRRLVGWQVDPVVRQLALLRSAAVDAVEAAALWDSGRTRNGQESDRTGRA